MCRNFFEKFFTIIYINYTYKLYVFYNFFIENLIFVSGWARDFLLFKGLFTFFAFTNDFLLPFTITNVMHPRGSYVREKTALYMYILFVQVFMYRARVKLGAVILYMLRLLRNGLLRCGCGNIIYAAAVYIIYNIIYTILYIQYLRGKLIRCGSSSWVGYGLYCRYILYI